MTQVIFSILRHITPLILDRSFCYHPWLWVWNVLHLLPVFSRGFHVRGPKTCDRVNWFRCPGCWVCVCTLLKAGNTLRVSPASGPLVPGIGSQVTLPMYKIKLWRWMDRSAGKRGLYGHCGTWVSWKSNSTWQVGNPNIYLRTQANCISRRNFASQRCPYKPEH